MTQTDDERQVAELDAVLDITERIVRGVRPDQLGDPTPCDGFDVQALVEHVLGWASTYAARVSGRETLETEPASDLARGGDEFHAAAQDIKQGYADGTPAAGELPVGILLMDFCTHGWDLARATGQVAPYPDSVVESALATGRGMLTPDLRAGSRDFGPEVPTAADAPPLDRLVAFLGRDPGWSARS